MQGGVLYAFAGEAKANSSNTDGEGREPHRVVSVPGTVDQI